MESRQIVAVVLIIVIIAGVAVGIYMFLPPAAYGAVVVGQLVTPARENGTEPIWLAMR
jgi:hypothetical protein